MKWNILKHLKYGVKVLPLVPNTRISWCSQNNIVQPLREHGVRTAHLKMRSEE